MPGALLELRNVEARYGPVAALHGVSLTVGDAEVVAVLGANGAGKTTTLRAVSGTVRRSGEILLDGKPIGRGPEATAPSRPTSTASSAGSRACASGSRSRPARSPAASSRCSRSPGR